MIPKSKDVEFPLLEALIEIGGEGTPRDVRPFVTKRFPQLTEDELAETLKSGENRWKNRIAWARFHLAQKGEIDKSRPGIWAITDKGRKRVKGEDTELQSFDTITMHQAAIDKWLKIEEGKIGKLYGEFFSRKVNLNDVLPEPIWLKENSKEVDGLARFKLGGQTVYQSILEVQYKGSKEDLCVRVSIILPYVTRVDIVSDEQSIKKIKEFLDRLCDPNIVKTRVKFYSFKQFLGTHTGD